MVGSRTLNLVRHACTLTKWAKRLRLDHQRRLGSTHTSSDVGLEPFLCRLVVVCLEFVPPLEPRYLLVACLLNV